MNIQVQIHGCVLDLKRILTLNVIFGNSYKCEQIKQNHQPLAN